MTLLHQGFEASAERDPDALAVVSAARRLTYRQLERRANALAAQLLRRGVRAQEPVAVIAQKGWEQVVAVLAVLKAGGAYVPVDADLPRERLRQLLRLGEVRIVVTQSELIGALAWPAGVAVVPVPVEEPRDDVARPAVANEPGALAYVIFTSGSTGSPKGVMIEHHSAVATIRDTNRRFGVGPEDRVLGVSSLSFDLSVYDIFGLLTAGGALVLPPPERDPRAWAELIAREGVTMWNSVPALMELLVTHVEETGQLLRPGLRLALLAGDWLPLALPDRLRRVGGRPRIVNLGGGTEATIWSSWYEVGQVDPAWTSIPYGWGLDGERWYVLDDDLRPCPPGVIGELCIAGTGLARGYLADPERTRRSFPVHPRTGERLYRTGDLGRMDATGLMEFLGRRDTQVKIRGFRIELGEVEATLGHHPAVRQAAAIAVGDPRRLERIAAFAAPLPGATVAADGLRDFLAARLPEYMVPATCQVLDELPLTGNGKIDRAALARLAAPSRRPDGERAPASGVEERLAALLAEVLGLDRVGAGEDFFELGGHSLLAAQLVTRIRGAFDADVPIGFVLEHPTVEAMARALPAGPRSAPPAAAPAPVRAVGTAPAPLSFGQEQLWFLSRLVEGGNRAYHFQCTIDFTGRLEVEPLRRALTEVVRRHEMLRTTFHEVDGEPVQVVHPPFDVELPVDDLRGEPDAEAERRIAEALDVAFDIGRLPLIHWRLLRLADDQWTLIEVEHHLVHDGWSVAVLWREVEELYRAALEAREPRLPALEVQFRDFAAWQRRPEQDARRAAAVAYWRERLAGAGSYDLPHAGQRPRFQTFAGTARRVVVPADVYEGLRLLSRRRGCSLFVTMLAAFVALLHRYTGKDDLSVGSWMANRDSPGAERLIGMMVNSVVLRNTVRGEQPFRGLLEEVRGSTREAYANQDAPFDEVVRALDPPRDPGRNPLAQAFFSFHDSSVPAFDWPGVRGTMVERNNGTAKFDLNVIAIPHAEQRRVTDLRPGDDLVLHWEYNTHLFDAAAMDRMIDHYQRLLAAIVADPEQRVADLPLLSDDERRGVLVASNRTARGYPAATVHGLFEAQALRTPDAIVAVSGDVRVTYRELQARARGVAGELGRLGVGRGDLVAVCTDRSVAMLAAVLGVLLAGAAYVPLDPDHPPARHGLVLEGAGAGVVLADERTAALPAWEGRRVVRVDAVPSAGGAVPTGAAGPDDRAYVVHTSGSTGRPKGVEVQHRSVVNVLWAMREQLAASERDVLVAATTLAFDIAALELFLPLVTGGRVVIAARETAMDGARLAADLDRRGATLLQATPITWRLLLEAGWTGGPGLTALCGGERLPRELANALVERCSVVWNLYGPSETTIWSTSHRVQAGSGPVPIGRPIANTAAYVLDGRLQPVPAGVPGELYLEGDGVALGYLRQPGLTAGRFLPAPFAARPGARVYRTGDQVRWLPDGTLEFLGRIDRQVKVRGYRVEIEEVEAALARHPMVRQSVVQLRPGGLPEESLLVGYVVPVTGASLDPGGLTDFLRERLPAYMVPRPIAVLDSIAVSPNGKVDVSRLPDPSALPVPAAVEPAEPASDLERQLLDIWREVLRRGDLRVSDDFFGRGGHSLLALRLVSRIRSRMGIEVLINAIFDHPTVRELAHALEAR